MEIKKTLNEDFEYENDSWDDGEVAQGKSFFEDGYDWKWMRRVGDVIHLDFDNWAVWMAFRPEDENNTHGRNVVAFFIVDEDTGFIDWGPCDTYEEAKEFLDSKVQDWEMNESITHSPLSTAGEIPYAVKLLYMMDRFVMDVYDNEGWLMNGVPDGEFEETTADEAMKNYTEHSWLIEDENGGIDWDEFNDFIDTFASVTKSKSYDQEERSRLIDEADSFVGEYEKYGDDNDEKLMKMLNNDLDTHITNEDLESDLDKIYKFENAHEHPSILDNIKTLETSELVDHITPVNMYDTEVFEMVATDGRVFYLVPSTLSQFDVYDENEELVTSGEFTRSIPAEVLMDKSNLEFLYELVGGEYAGTYTEGEVKALPCFTGRYTADQSDIRAKGGFTSRVELDNKPKLDGYLGPMMGGYRDNKMVLRYETQDVYNRLSESWHDAYQNFISIIDDHFPNEEKIESSIEELYNQHKGDPDWDEAYRRWHEEDNCPITEDINNQDLESTLRQTAESKLFDMGYDKDFISEYFGIKVEDIEDHIKVTVWGELSYEEFSDLADVLNPIIEKEDPNAYLDNETTGRMVAYIRKDQSEDIPDEKQVAEWAEEFNACSHWEDLKDVYEKFSKVRDTLNSGTIEAIYKVVDKKVDELKPVDESLVKNPDQEGPYSKKQIEQDLYWLTDKFTRDDVLKCGYKEEAEYAEEILSKHYASVEIDKVGSWFQVEFKDALKKEEIKEAFSSNINLDKVVMDVANLLDDSKLGDNWIEVFPTADAYPITNGEYGIRLEITGADERARKAYFRTKNGRVEVAFVNGSEAMCNDEREIARFIAGEYGLTLNESINEDNSKNILQETTSRTNYTVELFKNTGDYGSISDLKNDLVKENYNADNDYDALVMAIAIMQDADIEDIKDDYPDIESCLGMLKDQYFDTGSKFILNVKKGNKAIFDFGMDRDEIISSWSGGLDDNGDDKEEIEDKKASGNTGDCTWTLEGTHLIISGSGNMGDQFSGYTPWGKNITNVIIEEGVTSIGDYAFYNCHDLTKITIPDSVTSIGKNAFSTCGSLTSITIPEGVTSIGEDAFWNCFNLTNIHLPDSLTNIGEDAFWECKSLTISCKKGSYAEQYAEQNNIPVKLQEYLIKNKEDSLNECKSMNEDNHPERKIYVVADDEDPDMEPYLWGNSESNISVADRFDLSEEELWATGWTGSVQNIDDGPFESFDVIEILCHDDEKGEEYDLPEIPEHIKSEFLKAVNNYISQNLNESIYNKEDHEVKTIFKNDKYIVELHPDAPKPYWVIDATIENPLHAEQCFYDEERAIRFAKEDSLNEGFFNDYIYLFPELTDDDIKMMAGYNIKYLGMNHGPDGSEDNWVAYGAKEDIEKYAEKYLGYELHPDYLYEYDDFAGEIV